MATEANRAKIKVLKGTIVNWLRLRVWCCGANVESLVPGVLQTSQNAANAHCLPRSFLVHQPLMESTWCVEAYKLYQHTAVLLHSIACDSAKASDV